MAIVTVTPNAAIDRTIVVPDFKIDGVFRETEKWVAAGGKGINVARAIHVLGEQAICTGFLGGWNGKYLNALLEDEAIPSLWTHVRGETRSCTIIIDPVSGSNTVVNERGFTVTEEDWDRLALDVIEASKDCDIICFSGSLPLGSPVGMYIDLITEIMRRSKSVWVDTSADTLREVAQLPGIQVKINRHELGQLFGMTVEDADDLRCAADEVMRRRWKSAVITLGSKGAAFISADEQWLVRLPSIKAYCAVGSGDSFLAGLVVGESTGKNAPEQIRMGAAAGAANTLMIGGGRFTLEDYSRILSETVVSPL